MWTLPVLVSSKEGGPQRPTLAPEQIEAVVARFAVRGPAAKRGERAINTQFPGVSDEIAATPLRDGTRGAATVTTGNIATGAVAGRERPAYAVVAEAPAEVPSAAPDSGATGGETAAVSASTNAVDEGAPGLPPAVGDPVIAAQQKVEAAYQTGAQTEDRSGHDLAA